MARCAGTTQTAPFVVRKAPEPRGFRRDLPAYRSTQKPMPAELSSLLNAPPRLKDACSPIGRPQPIEMALWPFWKPAPTDKRPFGPCEPTELMPACTIAALI